MDLQVIKPETRYGIPAADQILFNRHYVLGYSYYFRQAKWALEIVDPDLGANRQDNFRSDYRIPEMFRADLVDYHSSGYDRGHLVASANQTETQLQNSETFLLSNVSPMTPLLNRYIWADLEAQVRELNEMKKVLETYVICGPIFYFDKPVEYIGTDDPNDVTIPVPNAFFKSVLTENDKGALHVWSFIFQNEGTDQEISSFLVPTTRVEQLAGINLWERLVGKEIEREKARVRKMW